MIECFALQCKNKTIICGTQKCNEVKGRKNDVRTQKCDEVKGRKNDVPRLIERKGCQDEKLGENKGF